MASHSRGLLAKIFFHVGSRPQLSPTISPPLDRNWVSVSTVAIEWLGIFDMSGAHVFVQALLCVFLLWHLTTCFHLGAFWTIHLTSLSCTWHYYTYFNFFRDFFCRTFPFTCLSIFFLVGIKFILVRWGDFILYISRQLYLLFHLTMLDDVTLPLHIQMALFALPLSKLWWRMVRLLHLHHSFFLWFCDSTFALALFRKCLWDIVCSSFVCLSTFMWYFASLSLDAYSVIHAFAHPSDFVLSLSFRMLMALSLPWHIVGNLVHLSFQMP